MNDDRVEAEAAQLERREHRDAVAPDATVRDARARQQLAQHGRRLGKVDLLVQHRERLQARRGVARLLGGRRRRTPRPPRRRRSPPSRPSVRAPGGRPQAPMSADAAACRPSSAARRRRDGLDLAGDLVFVVDLGAAPRLELLEPPLEAAAPARQARDPLVGPGHHAGLPGLVQPQRGLPGLAAAAQRPGGEQVDDRAPRERLAGRRRETVGQPGQQAHARGPVRLATRRQAGPPRAGPRRRARLRRRAAPPAAQSQAAAPRSTARHDLPHRLAQLGALVGHGDHGERAVAVETRGSPPAPSRHTARRRCLSWSGGATASRRSSSPRATATSRAVRAAREPAAGTGTNTSAPLREERPDERLLSLVEVVEAVQDDGAGHALPGGHGGRGQLHAGAVEQPPRVELGAERAVQAVQIARLAGARARDPARRPRRRRSTRSPEARTPRAGR